MLTNVIAHPNITTLFTGRGTSLEDLAQLPELHGKQLVTMEQEHGNNVEFVSYATTDDTSPARIFNADGLLTKNKNIALVVRVADCLPILLYHEPSDTIGVIHAGRKGTEQKITEKVLRQLPSADSPLWIWLGPHICESCYQINRDTDEHYCLMDRNLDQVYDVFENEDVELSINDYCPAHENEKFYSYRAEGPGVPMNYGVIAFK